MKKLNLDIQMFASTNKTANYDLPQFVGTDKPTWLGDFNEAMFDIDAGMHANATNIESVETVAENASSSASQASQDVAGLTSTVNTLSSNVSAVTQTANNAQQTATSALNTANTANGKADTNASAISSIQSNISDIEDAIEVDTSYSTDETIVGKWIDGKPIYRRTIVSTLPSTTGSWKTLFSANVKGIIRVGGYFEATTGTYEALPYAATYDNIWFSTNNGNMRVATDSQSYVNKYLAVWFDYTKTTD